MFSAIAYSFETATHGDASKQTLRSLKIYISRCWRLYSISTSTRLPPSAPTMAFSDALVASWLAASCCVAAPVAGASATREPSKAFVIMSLTAVGRRSYFSSRTLGRITETLCLYHFFSVHFGFRLRFFAFGSLPPSLWRLRAFQSVPKRNSYPDGKTRKPSSMVQSSTHARQPDTLSTVPLQCLTELWAYPLVGSGDPHRWVSVLSHFLLRPASLGLALCSSSTQQRSRGLGEERRRSLTHHPAWPPVFNTLTSSRTFAETFTTCGLLALDTG